MFEAAHLHQFAEAIPHIVWSSLPNGTIEFCNGYGVHYLGATADQVVGQSWLTLLHPEEAETTYQKWQLSAQQGETYSNLQRIYHAPMRHHRWVRLDISPIRDGHGYIQRWIGIAIDVQSEIESRTLLVESNVKYESILDQLPATQVYIFDTDLRLVEGRGVRFANTPDPQDVVGKTLEEAFEDTWTDFITPLYRKALQGEHFYAEFSSEESYYILQGGPLNYLEDTARKGIALVHNLSVQKRYEASSKQSKAQFSFLLDTANQLVKLSELEPLYDFVGQKLQEIIGEEETAVVARIPDHEKHWEVVSFRIPKQVAALSLDTQLPYFQQGNILKEQGSLLREGSLIEVGTDFTYLSGGTIPPKLSTQLKTLLNVGHCYVAGISYEEKLLGAVALLTAESLSLSKRYLAEGFLAQVAVALTRAHSRRKLLESERRYRFLVDNMREGLILLDPQGKIVTLNHTAQELFELESKEEMIGENITILPLNIKKNTESKRKSQNHPILHALKRKKAQRGIIIDALLRNNRVLWLNMNIAPVFAEDGETLESMIVSFADISKLKRSEDKLAHYLRQQAVLSKVAQTLNTAKGFDAAVHEAFALVGEYTGMSRIRICENGQGVELFCQNSYEWSLPDYPADAHSEFAQCFIWDDYISEQGGICVHDVAILPPELSEPLSAQGIKAILVQPIFLSGVLQGVMTFEDCTQHRLWRKEEIDFLHLLVGIFTHAFERRALQRGLEQSEERLQQANRLAKLAHWEWYPATNDLHWSSELYEFFQLSPQDAPLPIDEHEHLYTEESTRAFSEAVAETIVRKTAFELELMANPTLAGEKYFHIIGIPELRASSVYRIFGSMQDITQRKLNELNIEKANQSLKTLNEELDLIMKTLSHDLKSPINQAQGLLRLLELEPQNPEIIQHMRRSLKKLKNITNDLLNLALNSRSEVKHEPLHLEKFLQQCVEEQEGVEGYDLVTWQMEATQDCPCFTDLKRLRIILRNLFTNAIKYRAETEGEKPFIRVRGICSESEIIITVSDNGIGIPEDRLEQIFEMFYQIEQTKKGVGLGLHIVKQMLQKLEGRIEVRSREGEGSTFVLFLPSLHAATGEQVAENA